MVLKIVVNFFVFTNLLVHMVEAVIFLKVRNEK